MTESLGRTEFDERVSISEHCKKCLNLAKNKSQYDITSIGMEALTEAGLSGELDQRLIKSLQEHGISREVAEAKVAENKGTNRSRYRAKIGRDG